MASFYESDVYMKCRNSLLEELAENMQFDSYEYLKNEDKSIEFENYKSTCLCYIEENIYYATFATDFMKDNKLSIHDYTSMIEFLVNEGVAEYNIADKVIINTLTYIFKREEQYFYDKYVDSVKRGSCRMKP